VMHGYRAGQGAARARVLYMFRTPPNMRVGRKSMDGEVREALEHTHPDLTFDWDGLLREPMPPRPDPRERGPRQRPQGRKEKSGRDPVAATMRPPVAPPAPLEDDETLLGRTLGAPEAARLRAKHAELSHRIARRARTPEERDRLSESAQRLNPDAWSDEAAIRAGIADFDARCDAVAAELPRRRRGRRGGKNRDVPPGQETAPDVIIGRRDEPDESDDAEAPTESRALDLDIADADAGDDDARDGDAGSDDGDTTDPGTDPETDLR
jgi:hypothetical protein